MKINNDKLNLEGSVYAQQLTNIYNEQTLTLKGEVWAFIEDVNNGEKTSIDLGKNVITLDASVLVARLIKDSTATSGLLYLAVGTGATGWNLQKPPAGTNTQTRLENELFRKTFAQTAFIKTDGSGDESSTPTNIVDFVTTYEAGEAVGPLVEMGLYGGDATGTPNSGTLFNYKTFPVINKSAASRLTLVWRITT